MCAAVTGRVSEVGEAGQSIVTGTGERLNVKWAAGVEEVSSDDNNNKKLKSFFGKNYTWFSLT